KLALAAAEDAHRAATAAAAQERAVAQARTAAEEALRRARELAEQEATLRRRRFAGIAAELAADLEEQAACPVCGSLEHPDPAGPSEDAVGPEQVEAAETARRTAEQQQSRTESELAVAREKLERLREQAGEH